MNKKLSQLANDVIREAKKHGKGWRLNKDNKLTCHDGYCIFGALMRVSPFSFSGKKEVDKFVDGSSAATQLGIAEDLVEIIIDANDHSVKELQEAIDDGWGSQAATNAIEIRKRMLKAFNLKDR